VLHVTMNTPKHVYFTRMQFPFLSVSEHVSHVEV